MQLISFEKLGGISLVIGSLLFAAYSSLFFVLLPIGQSPSDFVSEVLNSNWTRLSIVALIGILLMLVGFYAVYSRIRVKSGVPGAVGFLFIEAAYLLQTCKVTWELFLYPIIASHPESAFLLGKAVIKNDPSVVIFNDVSEATIFIGVVLFCLALYRSDEYPRVAPHFIFLGAIAYAAGPAVSIVASIAGIFVLAIGCSLLGIRLLRPARI
jgi:uncharacterized membrane protein YiaA